jgi:hypothetical protein
MKEFDFNIIRFFFVLISVTWIASCGTPQDNAGSVVAANDKLIVIKGPYVAPFYSADQQPNPTQAMRAAAKEHCSGARYHSYQSADDQNLFFLFQFLCT